MKVPKEIQDIFDRERARERDDLDALDEFAASNANRMREQVEFANEQQNLPRRTAEAVERPAQESAPARGDSTKAILWARVAAFNSLAALIVSAWPYIERLLK